MLERIAEKQKMEAEMMFTSRIWPKMRVLGANLTPTSNRPNQLAVLAVVELITVLKWAIMRLVAEAVPPSKTFQMWIWIPFLKYSRLEGAKMSNLWLVGPALMIVDLKG